MAASLWRRLAVGLCPPLAFGVARRLRGLFPAAPPWEKFPTYVGWWGRYGSYAEAARLCQTYNDPGLLDRRVEEFRRAGAGGVEIAEREKGLLLAVTHALTRAKTSPATVIDFGGEFGLHYRQYRKLGAPCPWWVVETSPAAALGSQCWGPDEPIRFVTDLADAPDAPDLALASSSLQYVDRPHEYLRRLLAKRPAFAFFDRLPLTPEAEDFVAAQRVGSAYYGQPHSYPSWFFSERRWLAAVTDAGYVLVARWAAPIDRAALDGKLFLETYQAMLFRREG